ncbi:MAG TPA: sigma-70 family RNA polymerase sigma factor [Chitinophagaceae bacterium]|nr:sigma-70 family RNA polymerase sigma factor [Chitinophagaceae bacterium]
MEQKLNINDLKKESSHAFELLYDAYFDVVLRHVLHNSGTKDDAEDLFQEVMIVLVHKIRDDNFRLSASLKTYVMAIGKNLWLKTLRNRSRDQDHKQLSAAAYYTEISAALEREKYYSSKLQQYLYKISRHCQGFIDDVFFKGKSLDQIKEEYGYTTRINAANQKYKCMEQIRRVRDTDAASPERE